MRLKLTLEYDGTGFRGWAAQPGLRTVEGVLRDALATVFPSVSGLAVAGRTDTGVHALGNVVSVDVEGGPAAGAVGERARTPRCPTTSRSSRRRRSQPDFHARRSARSRSYRYRIWRRREPSPFEHRRSWWFPRPLDEERLADAADLLVGRHDFRAFTPTETQHTVFVRNVYRAEWHRRGDALEFEITADSFLRHMVRTLVGTMLERPPERIAPLLEGRHAQRGGLDGSAVGALPRTRRVLSTRG